jgi:hypothetical protein
VSKSKECEFDSCNAPKSRGKYCSVHRNKSTISSFLSKKYSNMKQRVEGKFAHTMKRSTAYVGLPILAREDFYAWAKSAPEFLALYKQWVMCNFDLRLTPVVNRIDSSQGYIVGNMEWITNSQNCGLTSAVRKMKRQQVVYEVLGVKTNV